MQDLVGGSLGKYQILDEIGRGGFATVYRALDTSLDRVVALKVLAPHLIWDSTFLERFKQEARAAANLHHPNIVTIYEVHEIEGVHYIAMEYLAGRSLSDILEEQSRMSVEEAASIAEQLGSALDYTHASGLVHRDIKPSNIIVSDMGRATLTDFGIVKAATDTGLTATGTVLGTPEYMSPEQVMGEEVGPASDVYSLGLVCYEMLAGKGPFSGTSAALLHAQVYEDPPFLAELNQDLPGRAAAVIDRALAKDPGERFPSAGRMARALRSAIGGSIPSATRGPASPVGTETGATVAVPARATESPPASSPRARFPAPQLVVGFLVLAAVLVGGAYLLSPQLASVVTPGRAIATPSPRPAVQVALTLSPAAFPPPVPTEGQPSALVDAAVPSLAPSVLPTTPAPVQATATIAQPTPTSSPTPTQFVPTAISPTSTTRPPSPTEPTSPPAPETATPWPPTATAAAPTATRAIGKPGVISDFEVFETWRRGDEPNGTLLQSTEQVHDGTYAAELAYDFPGEDKDFVVFMRPVTLNGEPNAIRVWVYEDGSGSFLNVWIRDAQGQRWQSTFGQLDGSGWNQREAVVQVGQPWPWGHIDGPDNGVVDYPIQFNALVLDRVSGPLSGSIHVDDLSYASTDEVPIIATPTDGATVVDGSPSPGPTAYQSEDISYHDDFGDPNQSRFSPFEREGTSGFFESAQYHVRVGAGPATDVAGFLPIKYENFILELDVILLDGDGTGCGWGGVAWGKDGQGYDRWLVSRCSKRFELARFNEASRSWSVLADGDHPVLVEYDTWGVAYDRLRLEVRGTTFSFYANGDKIGDFTDPDYRGGYVGVGAGTEQSKVRVAFDNLDIEPLP
jgi:serine/threonine protein kinase